MIKINERVVSSFLFLALFIFCTNSAYARSIQESAQTWLIDARPQIHDETVQGGCNDALFLATAMYQADSLYLYAPLTLPPQMQSNYVLGADEIDISGGKALEINASVFQEIPKSADENRSIFWQMESSDHGRMVVEESSFGWRGDTYDLYVVAPNASPETFFIRTARQPCGTTMAKGRV